MGHQEYYMEDYATYSDVFKQHSIRIADMMRILDQDIQTEAQMTVGRPKDLFRMVMDMMFAVDKSYKKVKNMPEEEAHLFHYSWREDAKEEMRNLLKEELEKYFNNKEQQ